MKRLLSLCLLIGLYDSAAAVTVGERVWIALESPFLVDDGYATGVVQSHTPELALVQIRRLEERGERTLAGSCSGALEGVAPTQHPSPSLQQVPLDMLRSWSDGKHRFLQREQLGVRFQRWLDDAPVINPSALDIAIALSRQVANANTAEAFEMIALLRRSRAPNGAVVPVDQRLELLLPAAEALTELSLLHPQSLRRALLHQDPQNLFERSLLTIYQRLLNDYLALDQQHQQATAQQLRTLLQRWASVDGQWPMPEHLAARLEASP